MEASVVSRNGEEKGVQTDITDEPRTMATQEPVSNAVGSGSDPFNMYCEWPITRPDGAFQPTISKTTAHLLQGGMNQAQIQPALLVTMALMSSRLGYPISIMLTTKDPHRAAKLVESCRKLVPPETHIEFDVMKPEHLFIEGGRQIRGKCAVSLRESGFDKVLHEIESILSRGCAVRRETVRGKYDVRHEVHRADFPISIIGINDGRLSKKGMHPLILRVPISEAIGQAGVQEQVIEQAELLQSPHFKIRKSLARLKPRQVIIPFEDQLRSDLASQTREHADSMLLIMKNLISLWTIINQPPPVTRAELGASFYGADETEVQDFLVRAGIEQACTGYDELEPLVATKLEYYFASVLLEGMLQKGQTNVLSERQQLVFETVKTINLAKAASVILEKGDDFEKISCIAKGSSNWANREIIYEMMSRKSSEPYSMSTITHELMELCKMDLIERSKPKKSNQYGYYVSAMKPNSAVILPPPSTIQDPRYQGVLINVVNPITLQVEKV